ncbi:retrovirus-related pol polyprotein from transposon TNT 1-94 [Tanacetum coccineum]
MRAPTPICLFSKASKPVLLWHVSIALELCAINHLQEMDLSAVSLIQIEKDHLCFCRCAIEGKVQRTHKPESEDTIKKNTNLCIWNLYRPMHVASVNGKKYILVIVDDYSRLHGRSEQDNGTEFVNQTLHEYYEKVGISHETSVARSP